MFLSVLIEKFLCPKKAPRVPRAKCLIFTVRTRLCIKGLEVESFREFHLTLGNKRRDACRHKRDRRISSRSNRCERDRRETTDVSLSLSFVLWLTKIPKVHTYRPFVRRSLRPESPHFALPRRRREERPCIRSSNSRPAFRAACILRLVSALKFHPCPNTPLIRPSLLLSLSLFPFCPLLTSVSLFLLVTVSVSLKH